MVKLWCCVTPERTVKTTRIMASLAPGWREHSRVIVGPPPVGNTAFAVWGQLFLSLDIVPPAIAANRPFWFVDNGYWKPAGGQATGYYRLTYRGLSPILMKEPDLLRGRASTVRMAPWRKDGRHILLAIPSIHYGRVLGLNMPHWIATTEQRIAAHTDRPVVLRSKGTARPLCEDLRNCWAVVTHSSNVAVEAAAAGIPCFVEPTSAAAPVANLDLADLERPQMPDTREQWWASLMCQQFTLPEMMNGTAWRFLSQVRAQVDGK